MTILLDRRTVSRFAKNLRICASLPTHTRALEAVSHALDFRDASAMSARLRDNGVVTLCVPQALDEVTSQFLHATRPSLSVTAEHLRRMFLATNMLPESYPTRDASDEIKERAGQSVMECLLLAAQAWFGYSLVVHGEEIGRMSLVNHSALKGRASARPPFGFAWATIRLRDYSQ